MCSGVGSQGRIQIPALISSPPRQIARKGETPMSDKGKTAIAYSWGNANAGDLAITIGALSTLQSIIGGINITLVSRFPEQDALDSSSYIRDHFGSIAITPSPFVFARRSLISKVLERVYGALVVAVTLSFPHLAARLFRHNTGLMTLLEAESILVNGGNLFYWNSHRKALPRIVALLFPALLARRLGKPYGFLPQSMGPFEEGWVSRWIGQVISDSSFVLFREAPSKEYAATISSLTKPHVDVVPDLAFFLPTFEQAVARASELVETHQLEVNNFLAVTLRASKLGDPEGARGGDVNRTRVDEVASNMASLISVIASERPTLKIVAVQQTRLDMSVTREFATRLQNLTGRSVLILEEYDPLVLAEFYRNATALVGMRLHSLIFAMSRYTPVLGVYENHFGPKTPGTLEQLGLSRYCVNLSETPKAVAYESLQDLMSNTDLIRSKIQTALEREREKLSRVLTELVS